MKKLWIISGILAVVAGYGCSGGDATPAYTAQKPSASSTAAKAGESNHDTAMRVKRSFGTAPTVQAGTSTTTHGVPK